MKKPSLEDFLDPHRVKARACAYLARFPATRAQLRAVLLKRVARIEGKDSEETRETRQRATLVIDGVIEELNDSAYLDDERYALARAEGLLRRGASWAEIQAKLSRVGLAQEQIRRTLESLRATDSDAEWHALVRYARRRRLGPFRTTAGSDRLSRDKASLLRKGFGYTVVRRLFEEGALDE